MIFDQWVDFVVYTFDPDRVVTYADRVDVRFAKYRKDLGSYNIDQMSDEERRALGTRIVETDLLIGDDAFEAMEIGDTGSVVIWTREYVWVLRRDYGNHHRLVLAPRNPPQDKEN